MRLRERVGENKSVTLDKAAAAQVDEGAGADQRAGASHKGDRGGELDLNLRGPGDGIDGLYLDREPGEALD